MNKTGIGAEGDRRSANDSADSGVSFRRGQRVIVKDRDLWSRDRRAVIFEDDKGGKTIGVCTTDGHMGYAAREFVIPEEK